MTPGGMIGGYCEEGFPLYFANYEMVKLLGYDSYDELSKAIGGLVLNTIHRMTRNRWQRISALNITQDWNIRQPIGCRKRTEPGSGRSTKERWCAPRTVVWRLSVPATDISETMFVQQQLSERNAALLRQNQELHFMYNDMPGGYHRVCQITWFSLYLYQQPFSGDFRTYQIGN